MLPDTLMQLFSDCVAARTGMHFGRSRWSDLQRAIDALTAESSDEPQAALLAWLADTPAAAQAEALARQLAVGETYFFREAAAFDALEHELLPAIAAARRREGRRRLRLWSAGCCTGEEAYSLAIVLARVIPDLAEWDVSILATDLHPGFIERAQEGIYGEWSFRGVPDRQRVGHFDALDDGQRHAVRPGLKRLVRCRPGNLLDEPTEGPFDLVLCRHVLMYFEREHARQTVQRLRGALVDGGWLLVGPVEAAGRLFADFEPKRFGDAVFHRKSAPQLRPAMPAVLPAAAPVPSRRESSVDALAACEAAIAADKCNVTLHYLHALLLERADDVAGARRALRCSLFLDNRFVLAHMTLARLCEREGQHEHAQRHVDHALSVLNPLPPDAGRDAQRETDRLAA